MNYEYNGHLLEEQRILLVANEIVKCYPIVSLEKAKEAAGLEGRISNDKTIQDELNRLYNIMLVNKDDKEIVSLLYLDYVNVLKKDIINNPIYLNLIVSIKDYLEDYSEFPIISDYI